MNLNTLVSDTTKRIERISPPFVVITHTPNEEEGEEQPWEIHLDVRRMRQTDYYYYVFSDFWDIIKYRKLYSIKKIEEHFRDLPVAIDAHFEWLKSLSAEEHERYRQDLRVIQERLYPTKPTQ
jgi:hypothetical protein